MGFVVDRWVDKYDFWGVMELVFMRDFDSRAERLASSSLATLVREVS